MTGQPAPVAFSFDVHKAQILLANHRVHWSTRARITRTLRQIAYLEARRVALPRFERAHLVVTVMWPDRRRRDVANVHPTIKALVDGLVADYGALPDDDDAHLLGPDLRVAPHASGTAATRFRFELRPLPAVDETDGRGEVT